MLLETSKRILAYASKSIRRVLIWLPVLKSSAVLQIDNRSQHIQDGKIKRVVNITDQTV